MLANYTIDGFENIQYQGFGKLKHIDSLLSSLYKSFGYCQVQTPTFEAYDAYAEEPAISQDDLFKLISSTGKVLALKPDATLPIARMAAINHHDPEEIVKFCYMTNIYRNFSAPEIEKKETTQTGIEYFGNPSPECDAEIIALAIQSLLLLGIENIHIDIGHVGFINAVLDEMRLSEKDKKNLFREIENKNIGNLREDLKQMDLTKEQKKIILKLPRLYGSAERVFQEMKDLSESKEARKALMELERIYDHLNELGLGDYLSFDLGFTSRMNYYTGMIFKGYIEDFGEPVLSGGRYDAMSARFGIDRPACGFGLDLLLVMDYMERKQLFEEKEHARCVILYAPEKKADAFEFCRRKRSEGSAEMFSMPEDGADAFFRRLLKNPHYQNFDLYLLTDQLYQIQDGEYVRCVK